MSVAGKTVEVQGVLVDPAIDVVEVDGRRVLAEPLTYLVFHKPRKVMCTMHDPNGRPSVVDYLRDVGPRVVPVGRLDFETSGVMLLTNDGDLARNLLHPSRGVSKEYLLRVSGRVDDGGLSRFRDSIDIDGRPTRPARVVRMRTEGDETSLSIVIHEGRNRQIRRLAEHAGYRVLGLSRSRFGGLSASDLQPGRWRPLTASELRDLRALT